MILPKLCVRDLFCDFCIWYMYKKKSEIVINALYFILFLDL